MGATAPFFPIVMVIVMKKPTLNTLTETQQKVLKLWNKNMTSSQIAAEIKTTRSAVMGLVNRLRLKGFVEYRKSEAVRIAYSVPKAKTRQSRLPMPMPVKVRPPEQPAPLGPSVSDLIIEKFIHKGPKHKVGIPLTMLRRKGCKYAINDSNDPSKHLFCGETVKEMSSYCEEHHGICYVPMVKYKRKKSTTFQRSKYDPRS
jgi:hypothetical protein